MAQNSIPQKSFQKISMHIFRNNELAYTFTAIMSKMLIHFRVILKFISYFNFTKCFDLRPSIIYVSTKIPIQISGKFCCCQIVVAHVIGIICVRFLLA